MIKVLEHGIRKVTCPNCKAKLEYEHEDIQIGTNQVGITPEELEDENYKYIICPDCDEEIIIYP